VGQRRCEDTSQYDWNRYVICYVDSNRDSRRKRFCTPWKLISYAGLAPSTRESSGKTKTGRISKQGSPWLRWILVQSAMTAVRYDQRLKSFYERRKKRISQTCIPRAADVLMHVFIQADTIRHQEISKNEGEIDWRWKS
jgi:hypothetical protein